MKFLCLIFVFIFTKLSYGKEFVPVVIWEEKHGTGEDLAMPVLEKLESDDFSSYILKKVNEEKNYAVVIFSEVNLSNEDFTLNKDSYPNLKNIVSSPAFSSQFLTSVNDPISSLESLKEENFHSRHIHASKFNQKELHIKPREILIVKLDDAKFDEDRSRLLLRHDSFISKVYDQLLKNEDVNILALYTSQHSSWIQSDSMANKHAYRVRRLLQEDNDGKVDADQFLWNLTDVLLYSPSAPTLEFLSNGEPKSNISLASITTAELNVENITYSAENTTLLLYANFSHENTDYSLKFTFTSIPGYWSLDSIILYSANEKSFSFPFHVTSGSVSSGINAFKDFSYHCSEISVLESSRDPVGNETSEKISHRLTFHGFQIQPFLSAGENSFGDACDCTYFFTAPIWSGIFVTAILTIIMIVGLAMIMDIKTMDRFDDPKGKTITVNVSE